MAEGLKRDLELAAYSEGYGRGKSVREVRATCVRQGICATANKGTWGLA
jgi:hypothetical protein